MKAFLKYIFVFVFPLVILSFGLLLIKVNKQFSYHFIKGNCYDHGAWVYDRIFENETSIDVAFIGSSRTLHAINEQEIETHLSADVSVVNLGYCQLGRNFQYEVLSDLLSEKQPKLVVIEVTEDEQHYSHDSYPYIAKSRDLVLAPIHKDYFNDIYKGIIVRWEYLKANFIFSTNSYSIHSSLYGYGSSNRVVEEDEIEANRKFWEKRLHRNRKYSIEHRKNNFPKFYLDRMIDELEDEGVSYCFLFVPTSDKNTKNSIYTQYYASHSSVYRINIDDLDQKSLWMDGAHLNNSGASRIAPFVANFVEEELCSH